MENLPLSLEDGLEFRLENKLQQAMVIRNLAVSDMLHQLRNIQKTVHSGEVLIIDGQQLEVTESILA